MLTPDTISNEIIRQWRRHRLHETMGFLDDFIADCDAVLTNRFPDLTHWKSRVCTYISARSRP